MAKVQTLRDSTAFSVLAGCFTNDETEETISLLQVRYFTGDTLQRIFAVTRKRLSIQDINEALIRKNTSIDRSPAWRKVLQQEFGTVFFGDNFKKYSESYSQVFGFRSDKALRLFSQIVGLKVLGNLTEFIRMNMLEEQDTISRYEQLRSSYQNLMQSNREIQKAKAQIDLLEPIKENGDKWREKAKDKQHFVNMRQYVPSWYTKTAREIIGDELENIRDTLQHTINSREEELEAAAEIEKEIDSIKKNTQKVSEIDSVLSVLLSQTEALRSSLSSTSLGCLPYFSADYNSLDDDARLRLGSLVNSTLALSKLLNKTIA